MADCNIYLVRHGETLFNTLKRMQGWCDSDLTSRGQAQAIATGKKLQTVKFAEAVFSNLSRAVETGSLILQQLKQPVPRVRYDPNFREVFFGSFEGLEIKDTWQRIAQPQGYHGQSEIIAQKGLPEVRRLMKAADPQHWAESYDQVLQRWRKGLQQIYQQAAPDSNILIVTHGTFIRTLADYHGIDTLKNYPANASVSLLRLSSREVKFVNYNQ